MNFFVVCGEPSGDMHLSTLSQDMTIWHHSVTLYGVCGERAKKKGVHQLFDIGQLAIMGIKQAVLKYKFLKLRADQCLNFIKEGQIKNVILIDYGGFNLLFMKLLKKHIPDINIYYYIPPKIWIWGKRRLKTLKLANHILVIFPWEKEFYEKRGVKVQYFGNPLTEILTPPKNGDKNKILLLPGSRTQELREALPIYKELIIRNPHYEYIIKIASEDDSDFIKNYFKKLNLKKYSIDFVFKEHFKDLAKDVKLSVAVSGTVTLELALLEIPTVVIYKTSKINELFVRLFVRNLKYIALPNIILKKMIFKELLQKKCNVKNIELEIKRIENSDPNEIKKNAQKIRKIIGGKNAVKKNVQYILDNAIRDKRDHPTFAKGLYTEYRF